MLAYLISLEYHPSNTTYIDLQYKTINKNDDNAFDEYLKLNRIYLFINSIKSLAQSTYLFFKLLLSIIK